MNYHIKIYTGWLKKSKLLTQYNSLLFFETPCTYLINIDIDIAIFRRWVSCGNRKSDIEASLAEGDRLWTLDTGTGRPQICWARAQSLAEQCGRALRAAG